ncbi:MULTISPECIES: hypothetical protein [Burkholderia]|uniref:hypothetical protein n=1 Tax=Burkholderia TaxID=32008 RepID=UPI000A7B6B51|nr:MULTISPECIES: hypothetical protein [Burkholderia]
MAINLIKARHGVYGRQATEKEREQLKQFARDYVASTSTHSAADAEVLRRLTEKMLGQFRAEGHSKAVAGGSAKARAGTSSPRKGAAPVKTPKVAAKRKVKSAAKVRAKE